MWELWQLHKHIYLLLNLIKMPNAARPQRRRDRFSNGSRARWQIVATTFSAALC